MAQVEPRTLSFEDLIKQVRAGVLRCPRFSQRKFVWRGDQILKFFESVRLRYPVGSLLIWRTRERYASFERVGPIAVPPNEPKAPAEVGYVLDGHQRLSVIFGVFALEDADLAGLGRVDRLFLVYYDLDTEKFVHERHVKEHHLPVRHLLGHDDQLADWLDERRDKTIPGSPERARWDAYRRQATQLQTTFAQYRLPYLDITDANLDEAVNIFCLVNSQGTPVRRAEVFAALTWREGGFDFAGAAQQLIQQYPRYGNFGTDPILRSLLAALGENLYDNDWQRVLDAHRPRLPQVMGEVSDAFGRALEFLETEFGAASGKVIPYSLHIVLLTEFFRQCESPSDSARVELTKWLWATSFASAYTSASNLHFNDAVRLAQRLAQGETVSLLPERLRLRAFPRRFHPKSARVRVFHLFLKARQPRDLITGEVLPNTLLCNGMADARAVTLGGGPGPHAWRLAGRLLLGASRRIVINDLKAVASRPDAQLILRSHLIPQDAFDAVLNDDLETFLDLRERELIREERVFASQYVDLSDEETEEDAEIDVEEDPESDL